MQCDDVLPAKARTCEKLYHPQQLFLHRCAASHWTEAQVLPALRRSGKPIKGPFKWGSHHGSRIYKGNVRIYSRRLYTAKAFTVLTCGCERGKEQEDEHAWSVVTFLKACFGLLYAELTFIWCDLPLSLAPVRKAPVVLLGHYRGSR